MCQSITVSHNSIYDVPRAGINVSEGTWGGHVIEYNDVFNTVKESGDHGSFNSWGRDRYWHPDKKVLDSIVENHYDLTMLDIVKPVILRITACVAIMVGILILMMVSVINLTDLFLSFAVEGCSLKLLALAKKCSSLWSR